MDTPETTPTETHVTVDAPAGEPTGVVTTPPVEPPVVEPVVAITPPEVAPVVETPAIPAPAIEPAVETTPAVTNREALGITKDVRVGTVTFNVWTGQASFKLEEGQLISGGFVFHRTITDIGVAGETYDRFLALQAGPDGAVVSLVDFLDDELMKLLEAPATPAA